MSDPIIIIRLDGGGRSRQPGETLAGSYRITDADPEQIKSIEASVLWYTEGKGDEDMAVHEFWRRNCESEPFDPDEPVRFSTVLPNSPLSYDGEIVQVRWCVRVRVFTTRGKDLVAEKIFHLGDVPAPKASAS